MSPAELLLVLLLGGDGWAELSMHWRHRDRTVAPGFVAGAIAAPEPGFYAAAAVTLRSSRAPRLGVTPVVGLVEFRDPFPADGTEANFHLALRFDYQVADRLHLVAEARHVSNGADLLDHGRNNPGHNAALFGAGVSW